MSKNRIVALVAIVGVVAIAVVAFAFFKPPEEASGPVAAPTIAVAEVAALPTSTPEPVATATTEPTVAVAEVEAVPTDTPVPMEETEATTEATEEVEPADSVVEESPATGVTIFEIAPSETEARFIIEEVLRGADKTVVGTTNQVVGQIALDLANPANSQIGEILVNARTLTTDNEFRNRAVKNRILRTNDFEFVSFVPTAVLNLPDSVAVGDEVAFQIVGDLTITDVTNEVTFDVTVNIVSEDRIQGTASTEILYADFNLAIPDAQAVDTVEDEVILELNLLPLPSLVICSLIECSTPSQPPPVSAIASHGEGVDRRSGGDVVIIIKSRLTEC